MKKWLPLVSDGTSIKSATGVMLVGAFMPPDDFCDFTADDMAFVVLACNNHDVLVAALKDARDEIARLGYASTAQRLDAILASVEGQR